MTISEATEAAEAPPPTPHGMGSDGTTLWESVTARFSLEPGELSLLETWARLLDDITAMREQVEADGLMIAGSRGQQRQHPLLAEIRASRLAAVKVAATLALPSEDEQTPAQIRAARAARARWLGGSVVG